MGNVAAILGVVLLLVGVVFVDLFGNSRTASWGPVVGIALVVLGLSVGVVGAVAVAALGAAPQRPKKPTTHKKTTQTQKKKQHQNHNNSGMDEREPT